MLNEDIFKNGTITANATENSTSDLKLKEIYTEAPIKRSL